MTFQCHFLRTYLYTYPGMYPQWATGATRVAPKFSDTLTLFQPGGGEDYAHHWRSRT